MSNFLNALNAFTKEQRDHYKNCAQYQYATILCDFSIALVDYRAQKGITQKQLADELGVTQSMISQYESGENNVSVKRMCEICEKIGMSVKTQFIKVSAGRTMNDATRPLYETLSSEDMDPLSA